MQNKFTKIVFTLLWLLNIIFILLFWISLALTRGRAPQGWGISEFLINYQGGFVRRGLLGEIIYDICCRFSFEPQYLIIPLCIASFLIFCLILLFICRVLHASCWALPTFYCLFGGELIRKDFLIMNLAFFALTLYQQKQRTHWHVILATIIFVLALNLHEVIFFIAAPAYFLIVFSRPDARQNLRENLFCSLILIFSMGLLCLSKGDANLAESVSRSWQVFYPEEYAQLGRNAIGALSWDLAYAAKFHLKTNFVRGDISLLCVPLRALSWLIILYLMVRVTLSYHWKTGSSLIDKYIYIATLHFAALLPMWTILSCDFHRVVFYWTCSSLLTLYFLRDSDIIGMNCGVCRNYLLVMRRMLSFSRSDRLPYWLVVLFSIPYLGNSYTLPVPYTYAPPFTQIFRPESTGQFINTILEALQSLCS